MSRFALAATLLVLGLSPAVSGAKDPGSGPLLRFDPADAPLVRLRAVAASAAAVEPGVVEAPEEGATPLSLARCDFDGDGMPDVVAGWATPSGGRLRIHRGNVDFLWPDRPEARRRRAEGSAVDGPFLPGIATLRVALRPEALACGQLDGDGRADLVVAQHGVDRLELLLGDGRGGVERRVERPLPGPLTALAAGDVNRPDGLDDLVLGVGSGGAARLLVLEGPTGALSAEPETIAVADSVRAIALGLFDGDGLPDVALAAGGEVILAPGRDRALSLGDRRRLASGPAVTERLAAGVEVEALTAIDLEGRGWPALAALTRGGELLLLDPRGGRSSADAPSRRVEGLEPGALRGARLVALRSLGHRGEDLVALAGDGSGLTALPGGALASARGGGLQPVRLQLAVPAAAALPLRLERDGLDDLVVLQAGAPELVAILSGPTHVFVVDTAGHVIPPGVEPTCESWYGDDDDLGDGVCHARWGGCTLMAAQQEAAASAGADAITFAVQPLPGDFWDCDSIAAPADGGALTIDGSGVPGLELYQILIQAPDCVVREVEVLDLQVAAAAPGTTVEGSLVDFALLSSSSNQLGGTVEAARNRLGGITFDGVSITGNVVEGNWIGTEDGVTASGGGVTVGPYGATFNTRIGGMAAGTRNLIAGGGEGVDLESYAMGSLVQGNFIGTDATGTLALGNLVGVEVSGPGNTIGGTATAARNVFGAGDVGVRAYSATGTPPSLIQGNWIGTDVSGQNALGFDVAGVEINLSTGIVVGGATAGAGNLISGNGSGATFEGAVWVRGASSADNEILGNRIGTESTGTTALGNYRGIRIDGAAGTRVGGTTGVATGGPCTGACNLIAASTKEGIRVGTGSSATVIEGNFLGTDVSGTLALANENGIWIDGATSTRVGGTTGVSPGGECGGACNLIAAATLSGIVVVNGSAGSAIEGNFLGTDVTGLATLGIGSQGISISASPGTRIGGDEPAARNVLAATGLSGIRLSGAATTGTIVRGNLIGLGTDGETLLGNGNNGITLTSSANGNSIGGPDADQGNFIAGSGGYGIRAEATAGNGNAFLSNRIWGSFYPGIDLGVPGNDVNDPGDADTGANDLQNYPVLTQVILPPDGVSFQGSLDSAPLTEFTLQFFDDDVCGWQGHGEGRYLLGSGVVTTGADGLGGFAIDLPGAVAFGVSFAATATDPDGNTSEFSACLAGPVGVDVRIRKRAPATAVPGQPIEFELEVENVGNVLAPSVVVTDTLDSCLGDIVCTSSKGACELAATTATAALGDLDPLESVLVILTARVGASCPEELGNSASAATNGDVNLGNNSSSTSTHLEDVFSDGFESGDTGRWTVTQG